MSFHPALIQGLQDELEKIAVTDKFITSHLASQASKLRTLTPGTAKPVSAIQDRLQASAARTGPRFGNIRSKLWGGMDASRPTTSKYQAGAEKVMKNTEKYDAYKKGIGTISAASKHIPGVGRAASEKFSNGHVIPNRRAMTETRKAFGGGNIRVPMST